MGQDPRETTTTEDVGVVLDLTDPASDVVEPERRSFWQRLRGDAGRVPDDAPETDEDVLRRLQPEPRKFRSAAEARGVAREWMQFLAFADAVEVTDEPGVDVESSRGVARVLSWTRPVSVDVVKEAHNVATIAGKHPLVFTIGSFEIPAAVWADEHPTALFALDRYGHAHPANAIAVRLLEGANRRALDAERGSGRADGLPGGRSTEEEHPVETIDVQAAVGASEAHPATSEIEGEDEAADVDIEEPTPPVTPGASPADSDQDPDHEEPDSWSWVDDVDFSGLGITGDSSSSSD